MIMRTKKEQLLLEKKRCMRLMLQYNMRIEELYFETNEIRDDLVEMSNYYSNKILEINKQLAG